MAPLEPYDSTKPEELDTFDHTPEEEIPGKVEPEEKVKKVKKPSKKPETTPEEKKLVLGKPKEKPEEKDDDISLKYKQKELPMPEPEEIKLKPFTKEAPTDQQPGKDLSIEKPVYPDSEKPDEVIESKEFEGKDKPKKKTKKKKPLQLPTPAEETPSDEMSKTESPDKEATIDDIPIQDQSQRPKEKSIVAEEVDEFPGIEKALPVVTVIDELAEQMTVETKTTIFREGSKKRVTKQKVVTKIKQGKEEVESFEEIPTEGLIVDHSKPLPEVAEVVPEKGEDMPDKIIITDTVVITPEDKKVKKSHKRVVEKVKDGKEEITTKQSEVIVNKKYVGDSVVIEEFPDEAVFPENIYAKDDKVAPENTEVTFEEVSSLPIDETQADICLVSEADDTNSVTITETSVIFDKDSNRSISRKKIIKTYHNGKESVDIIHDFPSTDVQIEEIPEDLDHFQIGDKDFPREIKTCEFETAYTDSDGNKKVKRKIIKKKIVKGVEEVISVDQLPEESIPVQPAVTSDVPLNAQEPEVMVIELEDAKPDKVEEDLPTELGSLLVDILKKHPTPKTTDTPKTKIKKPKKKTKPDTDKSEPTPISEKPDQSPQETLITQEDKTIPEKHTIEQKIPVLEQHMPTDSKPQQVVKVSGDDKDDLEKHDETVNVVDVRLKQPETQIKTHTKPVPMAPDLQNDIPVPTELKEQDKPQPKESPTKEQDKTQSEDFPSSVITTLPVDQEHKPANDTDKEKQVVPQSKQATSEVPTMPQPGIFDNKQDSFPGHAISAKPSQATALVHPTAVDSAVEEPSPSASPIPKEESDRVKDVPGILEEAVTTPEVPKKTKKKKKVTESEKVVVQEQDTVPVKLEKSEPEKIQFDEPTPKQPKPEEPTPEEPKPEKPTSEEVKAEKPKLEEKQITPEETETAVSKVKKPKKKSKSVTETLQPTPEKHEERPQDIKQEDESKPEEAVNTESKKKTVPKLKKEEDTPKKEEDIKPKAPEKLKLKKEKLEVKEIKPQKLKIEEKKDETPLLGTIKLRKASITEKKDVKPATQLPKFLLKSLIKRVPFPPEMHTCTITEINAVVDNGILSRNYEEAAKIKKKKIKKIKLPEIEKAELEEYVPFKLEKEEVPQKQPETVRQDKVKEDIPEEQPKEMVPLKIGKGKMPEKQEVVDHVTLKKVKPKQIDEEQVAVESPKKLKPQEEIPKKNEEDVEIKMAPLEPYDSTKPEELDTFDHIPEEEIPGKVEPEEKVKKVKKPSKKPETTPEEKKLVLGKPKEKPEEKDDDISLKYKQKELPKPEPEEIKLKPFTKDTPTDQKPGKDLSAEKPVYPDSDKPDEEITPKEFASKDKPRKKTKKKKPSELPSEESPEEDISPEDIPKVVDTVPEKEVEKSQENKKPKELEKLKPMKIEKHDQKPTKLKVDEVQPEELFSKKLRKSSIGPKKETKPVEVKKILLKSKIKRIPYPPDEKIPAITQMPKVVMDQGVLSRNYEEAVKIKKQKLKKVKLPEIEKAELEKYEPGPEYVKEKEQPITETILKPKEKLVEEKVAEEPRKLKIGKGKIPEDNVEDETVTLKKIPEKPAGEQKEEVTPEKKKPEEPTVPKQVVEEKEVTIEPLPLHDLDIPQPSKEIESPENIDEKIPLEKPKKPSKKQKDKPKKEVPEEKIVLETTKEKPIQDKVPDEPRKLDIGKGNVPKENVEDETVTLKRIPEKPAGEQKEEVIPKEKKPEEPTVPEKEFVETKVTIEPLPDLDIPQPSREIESPEKNHTEKPKKPSKKQKDKPKKEEGPEEKTIVLEKPKEKPVEDKVPEEPRKLKIGKGKIPEDNVKDETVTLKKIPEKPAEEQKEKVIPKEKKPEEPTEPKKELGETEVTIEPLPNLDIPQPTREIESPEKIDKEKPKKTSKKQKDKPKKEEAPEEKSIVLGKPKTKPVPEEEEVTLKKLDQIEPKNVQVEKTILKPFDKESPVDEETKELVVKKKPKHTEENVVEEVTVTKKVVEKLPTDDDVAEQVVLKKKKPLKIDTEEVSEEVTIAKAPAKTTEDVEETTTIKKKKKVKHPVVEEAAEEFTITKKTEILIPKTEEIIQEVVIKSEKPSEDDVAEEITLKKKSPQPKPDDVSEEVVITRQLPLEQPQDVEETTVIKKKKKVKAPVTEEVAEEFTVTKKKEIPVEKIEEVITEEVSIKKKKPLKVEDDEVTEEFSIKKKKPSPSLHEDVSEEVVIKKKTPKKPYVVEETSEEITIKKEEPAYVVGEESVSEEFIIRKDKPAIIEQEDISEEFVIKPKRPSIIPQVVDDVEEELVIKKKKKPKAPTYEEAAEELTITQEAPVPIEKPDVEDTDRMVVVFKKPEKPAEETEQITITPRRRSSVRKPSIEEHPEEKITLKQRRPSEDVVEEEIISDVIFKPKVTKPKEEIEQEFKISLQTYEEEDISMSGKVRLPRKKKIQPVSDEASAEMTIQKEIEIDQSQDFNVALRRKPSITTYNVEDVEQEVQLGLRQQQHRASIVYEEETLDIKVKRKPSKPSIPVFSQESAGLTITREEEVPVEKETTEGDILFSICSYVAENEEALNLVEGERVYVLDNTTQDWWFVQKHLTQEKGWVPAVYLRDEPSYTLYVQKKLHEKIDKLPIFEKPNAGEEVYAPRFVEKLQPKHVPDGATVQFECQVEGNPRPQITWFRQTAIIKPSQDFQIFYDDDNVATLIIREVFPEDAGVFTCVAKNAAGFASSTTELLVEAPLSDHGSDITGHSRKSLSRESSLADILEGIPPTFSRKPKAKIVKEGDTVELECRLVAVPEPEVTWYYKGKPVSPSDTVSVTTQSDMHMYSTMVAITKVKKNQEGVYQVVAKNREGQATLDIILKVKTGEPEPPEVVEPLQDVCISEGESAILATQITGKPTPKIVWSKDGKPDNTLPTKVQGETYSVTLIKPAASDSARYTVTATNKHGTATTSCQLTVEAVPGPQAPLFVERFEEQNVKEKGTIRLIAKVTGNPVPIVTWFRNNKTLLASPKQTQLFDGENIVLEIKDADSEEDAGDYKCVASNTLGTATHGARVTVDVEKVSFTKLLQDHVELNETETVTLACETSHTVSTKWRHNGVDLSGMDHRELVQEGRSHKLIIKRANPNDSGTYTCSVKDQVTSTTVVVHEMRPDFVRKLEDFEVKEQEVAILEVEISSEAADVVWVKDGVPLEPVPGKHELEKKGTVRKLLIRSTSVHDEGEYTCTLGDQECTAEVTVIELPPQIHTNMQDVTVTKGDKAILEVELTKGDALVRWFKDDKELHFSEHVQLSIDGKKQKLKIYQAEMSDAGTYSCRVGDQPDQVSTARVTVEVPGAEFITKLPDVTLVPVGADAEFTVELSSPGDVKWLKKGKEIKPSNKYIIKSEGTVHKLTIKKATTEDQSEITCTAFNIKTSSKLKVEKVEIAPRIKIDSLPKEYKVKKGEDVNIEVKFTASPQPTDEWTVNGTVVKKSKRVNYTIGEESASLTIKKVEESDVGTYTLRLKNPIGEASAEMTLIIMQVPGEPGTPDVLEVTDDSVTLHWKPPQDDGHSPITRYILEFHDKEEFMEWHEVHETITTTTHKVTGLKHEADIMFHVAAENEVGRGPNSHPTRYVRIATPVDTEAPVIQEPLKDSTVGLGKSITLECVIGGTPLPEVKWLRNGKPCKSKKMTFENRVASFTISDCTDAMTGTYTCKATNPAGSAETTCKLIVQDVPKLEVPEDMQDQRMNIAAQWKPVVTFSGFPRPEISWEKNGQALTKDRCKVFVDETTTTIAIYSVERSDTATYTVRAVNSAGEASANLTLRVIDKPGKPEGPITFSNMTAESITVEWRPPLDDGGLNLTKYILEKCEATKLIWTKAADVDPQSTTHTVEKLMENHEYMFRVFAQNTVGMSEALTSEPVVVRTVYDKPSPPQGPLDVSGMTETSCTISWRAPAYDGGTPILDYTIQRKEPNRKNWQGIGTVEEQQLTMNDLVLNVAYIFKITARNKEGESEPYVSDDPIIAGRRITPPSAPLNFNAINITSKSVTLQWLPPSSSGGTELTGYIIEKQYGDSKKWSKVVTLDPGHLEYCVENLKEKSELYFRIYAENSIGLSTPAATSVVSLKTHATVPSPPTEPLEIRSLGSNSIIVEWGVPETDGGAPLEGYKIAIRDIKKTMWMEVGQVSAEVQKLTIKDLQENHEYLVRIFARNEVGLSDPLESDEPFLVKKPTGMEEADVEERSLLEKDTPSLSFSTETTTSWMREAGMDADIRFYARGSLLRRSEYFFRVWYYAKHLFK